jgi:hypothetical protein
MRVRRVGGDIRTVACLGIPPLETFQQNRSMDKSGLPLADRSRAAGANEQHGDPVAGASAARYDVFLSDNLSGRGSDFS